MISFIISLPWEIVWAELRSLIWFLVLDFTGKFMLVFYVLIVIFIYGNLFFVLRYSVNFVGV